MSVLSHILKQNKRRNIPIMHGHFTNGELPDNLTDDEYLVLLSGTARDTHAVQMLMKRYSVTSAAELVPLLPRRKRWAIKERLIGIMRSLFGEAQFDPQPVVNFQSDDEPRLRF